MSNILTDAKFGGLLIEADSIISSDEELYHLATTVSIEAAAGRLGARIEPHVSNAGGDWDYWRQVLVEIHKLICTSDPAYDDLRKRIKAAGVALEKGIIPAIAGAIGATIGLAAGVLVPFVALAIIGIAKVGRNAWCSRTERIAASGMLTESGQPVLLEQTRS